MDAWKFIIFLCFLAILRMGSDAQWDYETTPVSAPTDIQKIPVLVEETQELKLSVTSFPYMKFEMKHPANPFKKSGEDRITLTPPFSSKG